MPTKTADTIAITPKTSGRKIRVSTKLLTIRKNISEPNPKRAHMVPDLTVEKFLFNRLKDTVTFLPFEQF